MVATPPPRIASPTRIRPGVFNPDQVRAASVDIPRALEQSSALKPGSIIIMEHPTSLALVFAAERYHVTTRQFGQTMVVIAESSVG